MHAVDVLGARLEPHEDDVATIARGVLRFVGREHDLAGGGTGRCREPGGDQLLGRVGIERRMEELIERCRIDPHQGFVFADQILVHHLDGCP